MNDWKSIPTTEEVYLAIYRSHHASLGAFSTFTSESEFYTAWGFKDSDFPIIEYRSKWEPDPINPHHRPNEQKQFWLCVAKKEKD